MTDKEKLIEAQDKIIELQRKVIELTEQNKGLREELQRKRDIPYYPYPDWPITIDPKTPVDVSPHITWSTHTTPVVEINQTTGSITLHKC